MMIALVGCRNGQREAPATGTYGIITNELSKGMVGIRGDEVSDASWTNAELAVIQTELSPATLLHSKAKTLSFFANMWETGLGSPTFAAIETQQGPKIFRPGDVIDPARMRDSWFVVWWAGATNWVQWDSPWFLTLQHRPSRIQFDTNGLHFIFSGEAGYAALMPLYGCYKPLQAGQESSPFALLKEKKKRVLTWEWYKALPADPLARAMYWASALKEFPVHCEENFSVDRAHDNILFQQKFQFISWDDDWGTKHLKLAPVSPVLALAARERFPVTFSKKPDDMEIFTSFGPYYGIQGVDEYTVTLPVMHYVSETAGAGEPEARLTNAPCFEAWQTAHRSGQWEALRQRWPELRGQWQRGATGSWAAFGPIDVSPFEQTLNALGAARIAYRLGDIDTYAEASQRFARALLQFVVQQRGMTYFRQNQPWKSMEPLATNAVLAGITPIGWDTARQQDWKEATSPDAVRIWRQSQSSHGTAAETRVAYERLIPGGAATPFVAGLERAVTGASSFLVQEIAHDNGRWGRIVWPDWKTSAGALWNFGEAKTATVSPHRAENLRLNGNTRAIVFRTSP